MTAAPPALGRGAVVAPGQEAPAPLDRAPRVRVDDATLGEPGVVADRLHRLWMARRPYVVELAVEPAVLKEPEVIVGPVWSHPADLDLARERLAFLVWANTPAWIDGGPRQPLQLDAPVVHRESTALAADQLAAVHTPTSCARVVAPAGSGKTRVLTERLRHLLRERGVERDVVLTLAYNTAAAEELRSRLGDLGAKVTTLHAHGLSLLRRGRRDLVVWEERQVRDAVGGLLRELGLLERHHVGVDLVGPYVEALDLARTALIDPAVLAAGRDDLRGLDQLAPRYRALLAQHGAVDFAEMIAGAIELLLADPAARRAAQGQARHVLVDEFQDLTPAYLLLIRLLAAPALQVFGVGDDDQVIYGHAGATPDYLLRYGQLFPGAADHPLTVNYRCPPAIVAAASTLLTHNQRRVPKAITAAPRRVDPPSPLRVVQGDDECQAAAAADAVVTWLADGVPASEIAILARVNVALLPAQVALAERRVRCASPLGSWLLQRTGVRAALAYVRLATAVDARRGDDLAEVLHRPFRRLPASVADRLRGRTWSDAELRALPEANALGPHGRRAWERFLGHLDLLRTVAATQPTAAVLRAVRDAVGLGRAAERLDAGGDLAQTAPSSVGSSLPPGRSLRPPAGDVGASHADDLAALLSVAPHCPQPAEFTAFLARVLRWSAPDDPAVVRLTSVHRVKGLQWRKVVVVGCAEGITPHRLAITPAALEEERRVFHVALTRAAEQVLLVAPQVGRSRFLAELAAPNSQQYRVPVTDHGQLGVAVEAEAGRRVRRKAPPREPQVVAVAGLGVIAPGGIAGNVEVVGEDGVLVRTRSGALLRIRWGTRVEAGEERGRLARPA